MYGRETDFQGKMDKPFAGLEEASDSLSLALYGIGIELHDYGRPLDEVEDLVPWSDQLDIKVDRFDVRLLVEPSDLLLTGEHEGQPPQSGRILGSVDSGLPDSAKNVAEFEEKLDGERYKDLRGDFEYHIERNENDEINHPWHEDAEIQFTSIDKHIARATVPYSYGEYPAIGNISPPPTLHELIPLPPPPKGQNRKNTTKYDENFVNKFEALSGPMLMAHRQIMHRVGQFVARHGAIGRDMIQARAAMDPSVAFVLPRHCHHSLFLGLVSRLQTSYGIGNEFNDKSCHVDSTVLGQDEEYNIDDSKVQDSGVLADLLAPYQDEEIDVISPEYKQNEETTFQFESKQSYENPPRTIEAENELEVQSKARLVSSFLRGGMNFAKLLKERMDLESLTELRFLEDAIARARREEEKWIQEAKNIRNSTKEEGSESKISSDLARAIEIATTRARKFAKFSEDTRRTTSKDGQMDEISDKSLLCNQKKACDWLAKYLFSDKPDSENLREIASILVRDQHAKEDMSPQIEHRNVAEKSEEQTCSTFLSNVKIVDSEDGRRIPSQINVEEVNDISQDKNTSLLLDQHVADSYTKTTSMDDKSSVKHAFDLQVSVDDTRKAVRLQKARKAMQAYRTANAAKQRSERLAETVAAEKQRKEQQKAILDHKKILLDEED